MLLHKKHVQLISASAVLIIAQSLLAADGSSGKKLFSIDDLYRFESPVSPRIAPDGQKAIYERQWIDPQTKQTRHSLWLLEGKPPKARFMEKDQLDARSPIFSPDGRWIAFLSTRSRPKGDKAVLPVPPASDEATDIWLIPTAGGPSRPLAGPDRPYGRVFNDGFYGRFAFSPDGSRLLFVADDGKDRRTSEEIAADVTIVRPDQGERYTGYGPAQVWVAELDSNAKQCPSINVSRLTQDDIWYGDPHWSPDGKIVAVHANKTPDRESVRYSINKNFDIYAIDVRTKVQTQLTAGPGPEISPRFSPDGKRIACLSVPRKGSHMDVFNLEVITLEPMPHAAVVADFHKPGAASVRAVTPSFPLNEDCWDGADHIKYFTGVGTGSAYVRISLVAELAKSAVSNGASKATKTQPLHFEISANRFIKDRVISPSRVVRWHNEGRTIEGILTIPPEMVARPPFKLIVFPHGGPHGRSVQGFDFTVQIFAAHGYAVLQPNFRGSSGYGQEFIDADRFDFGGGDMRDILTGIDRLVAEKVVNPRRQFLYGVSYGGYMTCWLVGHTNQFKAAAAQNAVTDLGVMWGLSDIQSWTEWEFGGRPWEVPGAMRDHSPISYVDRVNTPTLLLNSRDDRRCPVAMGRMFYQSLLARGVATQMVVYPDEGHAISQPRHRVDVLQRILAWFEKVDKG